MICVDNVVDLNDLVSVAETLATKAMNGFMVFLYGNLGAGKTTFVQSYLRAKGYEGLVKSPTYSIVEPYVIGDATVYHLDLYRLGSPEDLFNIGFEDFLSPSAQLFIEWPEKATGVLPQPDIEIYLSSMTNLSLRKLKIIAVSAKASRIVTDF